MPEKNAAIGIWVRRFLVEHLAVERNLARNTQRSYRDMFCQLMPFITAQAGKLIDRVAIEDLSPDRVRGFLTHVEEHRACGTRTRNQRLAAIHAFARFVAERAPEWIHWACRVRAVPFKRFDRIGLCYLEKPEIDALLAAPDLKRLTGRRDHTLLLFLYNTGARASEAAAVSIGDIEHRPDGSGSVKLVGKGAKTRHCPLWPTTITKLLMLAGQRAPAERVFINQRQQPLTRYGVHRIVRRHGLAISETCNSLRNKHISPHTIRHTTATHLLRSGVDINTIRAWLGHVSIDTTNVYAESDLETKAKMLDRCQSFKPSAGSVRHWKTDPNLMDFLRNL